MLRSRKLYHRAFFTQRRFSQGGFTLIEIMVVVIIIGILAAVVIPNLSTKPDEARVKKAKHDILTLENALEMYKMDNFKYPTTDQGLDALINKPASSETRSWKKYIKRLPEDPWGQPYQYLVTADGDIEISSFGADGVPGGEGFDADIKNTGLK